jgi:hypothetical protein
MSDKVLEILEYGSEGYLVDFKQEEYPLGKHPKKHEILKDISAMANHPKDEDKYIIIGAVEKNGMTESFKNIPELTDQAKYQQYLNSYIEPDIIFEYKPIKFKDKQLAYFRIFDNRNRPYLIKKEVQISVEKSKNQIVYREGDGFIKTGTGTRKMVRSDFESIYKKRYSKKDRKSDLRISPILVPFDKFPSDEKISVKTLDLEIENLSNKSIDFDIVMKVYKNDNIGFLSYYDFQKLQSKDSGLMAVKPGILPNFRVNTEEKNEYFEVSRTIFQNQKTSCSIAQNETINEVFEKEFMVVSQKPGTIDLEIIVRSDEFSDGAMIHNFTIDYEL